MNMAQTIEEHVKTGQRGFPCATGELTGILCDMALAGKIISSKLSNPAVAGILGEAGEVNVHGESVMKLDKFADDTVYNVNKHSGRLCLMGSEEREGYIDIPKEYKKGQYVLMYDPLDGSSNIDYDISVGTIFGIWRGGPLKPGKELVAAGYVLYGPSTMMVYTTGGGRGVHGFTYNRAIGEFLLSHPDIRMPSKSKFYSANTTYEKKWTAGTREFARHLREESGLALRWVGSLVADFHRNLIGGGVFMYPGEAAKPQGKLRLVYEAAPLALIAEEAGGAASTCKGPVSEEVPSSLHQRTPLLIGDKKLVALGEELMRDQTIA